MSYLNIWNARNTVLKAELRRQTTLLKTSQESLSNKGIDQDQYNTQWIEFNNAERAVNENIALLNDFDTNIVNNFGDIDAVRNGVLREDNRYASLSDTELDNSFSNLLQDYDQLQGFRDSNPYQYSQETIDGVKYSSDPTQPAEQFDENSFKGWLNEYGNASRITAIGSYQTAINIYGYSA